MQLSIVIPTIFQKNEKWKTYYSKIVHNIEKLWLKDYEIIMIWNKLVNEAWNEWVEKAKGKYIFIINDDIILYRWTIEKLISIADYHWISCPYYSCKDDKKTIHTKSYWWIVWFAFMMTRQTAKMIFPIPEQLKIWFGDNYIYVMNKRRFAMWWRIHHWESKSVLSPEYREKINKLIEQDKIERALLCKERQWKC